MGRILLFEIVFSAVLHHGLGTMNFALHKAAVQSTTSYYKNFSWNADKAVDGNTDGSNPETSMTCSATDATNSWVNHTWEVEIGFNIAVKTITVYGRTDTNQGTDQLSGFNLYLGNNSRSWTYNQQLAEFSSANKVHVFKPNNTVSRFISLVRLNDILTICEVNVDGECTDGVFSEFTEFCNNTCGKCVHGQPCNKTDGTCPNGCDPGWKGTHCNEECDTGKYGKECSKTCGNCFHGNDSCSKENGSCTGGCKAGWQGDDCKKVTFVTVTHDDVGPNVGVIVGSVLAAVGVSIFAMVIIIVIVKKRKRDNNETNTENVTTAAHYPNSVVGDPDTPGKITTRSRTEKETTFSAIEETSLQRGMPLGSTNSHSGVKEPDVTVHNDYEKLQDGTESTESAYATIDHNLIDDQNTETMENCSNYVENLQSLESALKRIEEEISVLLDRKEKLLCKELKRARANKLQDKRKKMDSTKSDTGKDYTNVNDQRRDDLEHCGNFVQMLQSLEGELRILEEKRKCLLERKVIFLRQELAKTTVNEK